jgi:hypothetical protein
MNVLVTSKKCWLAGWVRTRLYWGPRWFSNFLNFAKSHIYVSIFLNLLLPPRLLIIHAAERNDKNVIIVVATASPQHELERETSYITFADEADALLPCFSKKKKGSSRVASYTGRERMGNG